MLLPEALSQYALEPVDETQCCLSIHHMHITHKHKAEILQAICNDKLYHALAKISLDDWPMGLKDGPCPTLPIWDKFWHVHS